MLTCVSAAWAANDPNAFDVTLRNLSNSVFTIDCIAVTTGTITNGTDTTASYTSGLFSCSPGGNCSDNVYKLNYNRTDATHAESGRCETNSSPTLKGDGVMVAELEINNSVVDADDDGDQSNQDPGSGVFYITAQGDGGTSEKWDVINVNNSEGLAAFGSPYGGSGYPAFEVDLFRLLDQWITVTVTRTSGLCKVQIDGAAGGTIKLGYGTTTTTRDYYITETANKQAWLATHSSWDGERVKQTNPVPCRLDSSTNQLIVYSRAANYKCSVGSTPDDGYVYVRKVYWDAD